MDMFKDSTHWIRGKMDISYKWQAITKTRVDKFKQTRETFHRDVHGQRILPTASWMLLIVVWANCRGAFVDRFEQSVALAFYTKMADVLVDNLKTPQVEKKHVELL